MMVRFFIFRGISLLLFILLRPCAFPSVLSRRKLFNKWQGAIELGNHHFNFQLLGNAGKDLRWTLKPSGERLGGRAATQTSGAGDPEGGSARSGLARTSLTSRSNGASSSGPPGVRQREEREPLHLFCRLSPRGLASFYRGNSRIQGTEEPAM